MTSADYRYQTWETQPAAERFLQDWLAIALESCPPAARFATRLLQDTGVRLRDIRDFVELRSSDIAAGLEAHGWRENHGVYEHGGGNFPAFIINSDQDMVWFRVEELERIQAACGAGFDVEGVEHGPARRVKLFSGAIGFGAYQRSGYAGYAIPEVTAQQVRLARIHGNAFGARRRQFDTVEQGLEYTESLVRDAVADLGQHWACHLWFRAERAFWMTRCSAGRWQKQRQDEAGIGWSNIDHHTYDGSRQYFRHTIRILETLGYELREMLYAGELAGWGSQVLEQPALRSTIFADVDLAPEELDVDFAHDELPPLDKHRRAGMVCALHGESILQAGLNHIAALYDRRALAQSLESAGFALMAPFTDWDHLYQALTKGDWAPVDPKIVDRLEAEGHIPADEAEKIRLRGAIVTHFENIERNDGYKGFNREGIDSVLRKIDPRGYDQSVARG